MIYFGQKLKNTLNNNQSKHKIFFYSYFLKKKKKKKFYLRPVNARGTNNVKENKTDCKSGKGAYMCAFHIYPKFFMQNFCRTYLCSCWGSTV